MENPLTARARNLLRAAPAEEIEELALKVKAGMAAYMIFWTAIAFYVPQIALWIVGMTGIGLEAVPLANYVFPGKELFAISLLVIGAIGLCTMAYAAIVFVFRGIDCFSGWKGVIFICCLTCYLVMFINIFPWFIVWIFSVAALQENDTEEQD